MKKACVNYMQVSKMVIIKKCSTPAKFLFYYLNGIEITSSSSIIELSFYGIKEKCSSNQRRPKTKFLRATSKGNRDFYVRMGL